MIHFNAFLLLIAVALLPPLAVGLTSTFEGSSNGVGAARAMLFNDQHRAMGRQSEMEASLLDHNMVVLQEVSKKKYYKKKNVPRGKAGAGFGGGGGASSNSPSPTKVQKVSKDILRMAGALEEEGVVLVPQVLKRETAETLRDCIYEEIEIMRDHIRNEPSKSVSYFYVPAEIHFSTPRGYVLLPFRDERSVAQETYQPGPIAKAAKEMLQPGAPLADLFGYMLDGQESLLYDFCALRTEPGTARQVVHYDTPFQETPGLYCAFVALQDVSTEMGGTLFIPKTHKDIEERRQFVDGDDDMRDEMLKAAKPQCTKLNIGDAALFDMRILHAGLPNLPKNDGGANRLILAITFRNLNAKVNLGHLPNLRPEYIGLHTLGSFQTELTSKYPFAHSGDGIPP